MRLRGAQVRRGEDLEAVPSTFDGVASTYDLMVALNPGYHRHLRSSAATLVASLPPAQGRPVRVADLGCGSGASTAALEKALLDAGLEYEIVGVDGSAGMLEQARRKDWKGSVRFVQANAETLQASSLGLEPGSLDGVFAAYLLRNLDAKDQLLARVRELCVPGGALVVHEYSVADSRRAALTWDAVCWSVVVPLGVATAPRSPIYRYLWRSVRDFDGVRRFTERMTAAGLQDVHVREHGGWQRGILHSFVGRWPAEGPTSTDAPGAS